MVGLGDLHRCRPGRDHCPLAARSCAMRYRITNYRIDFERGILTKRIDTLELWHVDDINFEQGIVDRMMNVGTITVISDDRSTPRLELAGVPNPARHLR